MAIQTHVLLGQRRRGAVTTYIIMLASFPHCRRRSVQSPENRRFRLPHCRLMPLPMEPLGISVKTSYCQNLESLGYIFVADDCMGLSSFKFSWLAPKDACVLKQCVMALRPFKVIQGRWFWHHSKSVCDFLFVIKSNLGPILPRFRDIAGFLLRTTPPLFPRILGVFLLD